MLPGDTTLGSRGYVPEEHLSLGHGLKLSGLEKVPCGLLPLDGKKKASAGA